MRKVRISKAHQFSLLCSAEVQRFFAPPFSQKTLSLRKSAEVSKNQGAGSHLKPNLGGQCLWVRLFLFGTFRSRSWFKSLRQTFAESKENVWKKTDGTHVQMKEWLWSAASHCSVLSWIFTVCNFHEILLIRAKGKQWPVGMGVIQHQTDKAFWGWSGNQHWCVFHMRRMDTRFNHTRCVAPNWKLNLLHLGGQVDTV